MRTVILSACVGLAVTSLGCSSRLRLESSFDLAMSGKAYEIEPTKSEQTVKVAAETSGAPISVYVYLKKDEDAAEKQIMAKKLGSEVIASQEKTKEVALEARVPANEAAVVRFCRASAKGTQVKMKISN